jgi:hypothetical protein
VARVVVLQVVRARERLGAARPFTGVGFFAIRSLSGRTYPERFRCRSPFLVFILFLFNSRGPIPIVLSLRLGIWEFVDLISDRRPSQQHNH